MTGSDSPPSTRGLRVGIDARELQGRATGVGRYLSALLRSWPGRGDTLVLYFQDTAPGGPVASSATTILTRVLGGPRRGLAWQERALAPAARQDRLDVFFAPAYSCPLSLPLPRVTTVHDLSFFSVPDDFALLDGVRRRILVRAALRVSRRVIAVSAFTRREIVSRFPDLADRVPVVPHGSDDPLLRPAGRRRLRSLLSVGSILNRRRLPVLLEAVQRLRGRYGDLHLDVVGENRTCPRLDLPRLVERLGLLSHVRLSGFVDDEALADRYASADVAVYLSEYEGFGMPVLEAMSRGLPVVTSRRPATGELFAGAALTVDPDDGEAVAGAIARLFDDEALRARLAAQGRRLAEGLTWAKAAAATRDVLAEAAG